MKAGLLGLCLGLGLGGGLAGCDDAREEADLRGSVSRIYDLQFSAVRARLGSSELAIQYVAGDGQVPVQVILRDVDGPGTYALPARGTLLGSRDDRELPPLTRGTVTLEAYAPTEDAPVVGRFEAVLADRYSIVGRFDAPLEPPR